MVIKGGDEKVKLEIYYIIIIYIKSRSLGYLYKWCQNKKKN